MRNALLALTALAGLAALAASPANAAVITVASTTPSWTYTGGTSTNTGTSGAGNATVTEIHWGTSTGSGQSGLGFNPAQPPSFNATSGVLFDMGTLFHYNNPITGNVPTNVVLNLATNIPGAVPANQAFAFGFSIDETTNSPPCAYPGGPACADKITFTNIDLSNAFVLGGNSYTLQLAGFSTDGGVTVKDNFISNEGSTNSAHLYGMFIAPVINPNTPVPEPMSLALLGLGILGVGAVRARSRKEG